MYSQKTLVILMALIVSLLFVTSIAYAGFPIRSEKDVSMNQISSAPHEITSILYDSNTSLTPIAYQIFLEVNGRQILILVYLRQVFRIM